MFGWKAVAENGTTVNGMVTMLGCLDSAEQLAPACDPSSTGTLVYTAPGATDGWEWNYPAK